jgi:hypothetical protein
MSTETALRMFLGEDRALEYQILDADDATVAKDVATWALSWMLKRRLSDVDASALVTKTSSSGITVAGSFDAVAATSTQRATVALADTDTDTLVAGLYFYELKRTDAGLETVLAYGRLSLSRGVHIA